MPDVRSPMAGVVLEVLVRVGDAVPAGAELLILESMKMEIPVEAPAPGNVASVTCEAGQAVQEGDLLLQLA